MEATTLIDSFRVDGKVAVVTGAGSGIGNHGHWTDGLDKLPTERYTQGGRRTTRHQRTGRDRDDDR